jgi:tetratricopeptide (TPR) repeat protein
MHGKQSMRHIITAAKNSLFIVSSVVTLNGLELEVDTLLRHADRAQASRNMSALGGIVSRLKMSPLNADQLGATRYYEAQLSREDKSSLATLEKLSDNAPIRYRALSNISLGVSSWSNGDYDSTSRLFKEASLLASHLGTFDIARCYLIRNQAVLLGTIGDHKRAISLLQVAIKLVRPFCNQYPSVYFDFLNSYAVELMAVGLFDEAKYNIEIALASPFAPSYPEWHETARDIAAGGFKQSQSVVSVGKFIPANVLHMPLERPTRSTPVTSMRAELGSLIEWPMARTKEKPREDLEPDDLALDERLELNKWIGDPRRASADDVRAMHEFMRKLQEGKVEQSNDSV